MATRLVIADDHPIVLQGLQRLFESQADFEVIGSAPNGEEAIAVVRRLQPDVLLVDLKMPGTSGLDVLKALKEGGSRCRTVLLTAAASDQQVIDALQLGAMGIVLKESDSDTLLECLRRVHAGEQWLDKDSSARAFVHMMRREKAADDVRKVLTPREVEISTMVVQGLRNKAIAERLFISEGTVKIHLHNIYEKLGIDGRLELVLYAQQQGLA
jgi:DNA-binding NarL/FixJ family response regulator